MIKKNKQKKYLTIITQNKRAKYEYVIKQEFEAGLSLYGWEVKSIRAGQASIKNSYVFFKNKEAFLLDSIIQPLATVSSHIVCDPMRKRKLLLKKSELNLIFSSSIREGYTIIVLSLFWKQSWVKAKIGIAKGKKEFDKRKDIKKREWKLNKARIMRRNKL